MKHWTIRTRIAVGYIVVLAVIVAVAVHSYLNFGHIRENTSSMADDSVPALITLSRIQANIRESYALIEKHILSTTDDAFKAIEQRRAEITRDNDALYKRLDEATTLPEEKQLLATMLALRSEYQKTLADVLVLSRQNKNVEAFDLFVRNTDSAFKKYDSAVQQMVDYNIQQTQDSSAGVTSIVSFSRRITIFGVTGAFLLAAGIGWVVIRSINRVLTDTARTIGEGAGQVAAASNHVSKSSQALASGASEQAASLEETSSSLEELSSMTRHNAESAATAKTLSAQTRAAADTGHAAMTEMRQAMDAIKSSSADIAKIIKTIDEIAFQTNILALNAAVEAARAGEAGMGFAVVAEEVRNLAQRSAQSAKETASKIEIAIKNGDHGVAISQKVAASLDTILDKARLVDELVAQIATASSEQNQGLGQINTAVSQMDKVTQSNASSAEEAASAAEELNAQSTELNRMVEQLGSLVGLSHAAASGSSARAAAGPALELPPADRSSSARPALLRPSLPPRQRPTAANGSRTVTAASLQGADTDDHFRNL